MKKLILALLILLVASRSYGQSTTPLPLPADRANKGTVGDIVNTCPADVTAPSCLVINTQGTSTISVIISGSWTHSTAGVPDNIITFEATAAESGGWVQIPLVNVSTLLSDSFTAGNGNFIGGIGGYRKFRVKFFGLNFGSPAQVVLNASAGQTPSQNIAKSYSIYDQRADTANVTGYSYVVSGCSSFKNVQISVNATGENAMVASINVGQNATGPFVNYKNMTVGFDVPAIFNGTISSPYFQILIPNDGTETGEVTVQGGCNQ